MPAAPSARRGRPAAVLRAVARFLYENGVGDVEQVRAFLGLDGASFARLRAAEDWGRRRPTPRARTLALYLSAFGRAEADTDSGSPPTADARQIAQALRRFAAARLALLAEDAGGRSAARDVVDLTRCLKELAALEAAAEARERSEAHAADVASGASSDLAEIVALQVERLHRRSGARDDLEALYPPDEGAAGE
ncbi:MAG: hypothetical protein MEP57_08765 [Microvirga sp.]|nr:hypothetical protein [Microvirga sp.]